jgi:3-hydroxyacyl-[acyl-carrier-protein] dehydratase
MRWLLIDKILECEPGVSAVGVKTFPRSDEIFMDHFPGFPIVPGVLQIEMIAQMIGRCAAIATPGILAVLGNIKGAKFYRNVTPGDRCVIKVRINKITKSYILAEGEIEVDGQKCSSASILFGVLDRSRLNSNNSDFDAVSQEFRAKQAKMTSLSVAGDSGAQA